MLELEKEARLITSMSSDGHVTAQRDEQAAGCSPDSWPSRDTVGFISVFARPTPKDIGKEIRSACATPVPTCSARCESDRSPARVLA